MDIREYFALNGIERKELSDVSDEHRVISKIKDDAKYFDAYFQTGLDVFIESLDYDMNCRLFELMLQESKGFSDIFDPFCQSGIFGCYITSNNSHQYKGMDINTHGIKKAKERAILNGLDQDIFTEGDVLTYDGQHEAVVGRYAANDNYFLNPDLKSIAAMSRISGQILLIQNSQPGFGNRTIKLYEDVFRRIGIKYFDVLSDIYHSKATGADVFVLRARK